MEKKYSSVTLIFHTKDQAANTFFGLKPFLMGRKETLENDILIDYDNNCKVTIRLSHKEEYHLGVMIAQSYPNHE